MAFPFGGFKLNTAATTSFPIDPETKIYKGVKNKKEQKMGGREHWIAATCDILPSEWTSLILPKVGQ